MIEVIETEKAIATLIINSYKQNDDLVTKQKGEELQKEFKDKYGHSHEDIYTEIWKWAYHYYKEYLPETFTVNDIYQVYLKCITRSEREPIKLWRAVIDDDLIAVFEPYFTHNVVWIFKGYYYKVTGFYTDDEFRLLILEDFDKERRLFEKLKAKFNDDIQTENSISRPRIPESVRVEVWRRDSGKCARCGSREKLEYDHIVPISKGGSNTTRNVELLCEKHNRSKSNNVV